ncbi:MAG: methylmalonyl-CoA mutase [Acidobacteria bacterium]|nr:methylmalonyl-CoA mutase [Acidobacteriota bacterium]
MSRKTEPGTKSAAPASPPEASLEQKWREWERYLAELERVKSPRKSSFATRSGIPLKPVYTPLDWNSESYPESLGLPGDFPFTRGAEAGMYRHQLWTMGQYAGFGSAEDSNRRFKYLVSKGATGFSVALDLPTQIGYDSDHPRSAGEVGKVGVALNSLADMEALLDGVPLEKVRQIRTTANAIGNVLLAFFVCAAENKGISPRSFNVLLQNDPLKEYVGRGTYIYPPRFAVRVTADVMEYCARHLPNWTSVNVSGYHIQESGATAPQEIAFTFAHAREYLDEVLRRGIDVDEVAPTIWVFFSSQMDLMEEVAKFRAARRLWARMMRDEYGARRRESMTLRFLTFTAGSALTAQQPLNNVIRVTIQALAAVLAGTQTLHACSYDEALALPTEEAVTLAIRTQQIIAHETGLADVVDPLGGSYYLESLTNELEKQARCLMDRVAAMGGAVAAIEKGYIKREISQSAWLQQKQIESKERLVIGVNDQVTDPIQKMAIFSNDPATERRICENLKKLRLSRDNERVSQALGQLTKDAREGVNVVPATLEAVRSYATVGEICGTLREVWGEHRDSPVF